MSDVRIATRPESPRTTTAQIKKDQKDKGCQNGYERIPDVSQYTTHHHLAHAVGNINRGISLVPFGRSDVLPPLLALYFSFDVALGPYALLCQGVHLPAACQRSGEAVQGLHQSRGGAVVAGPLVPSFFLSSSLSCAFPCCRQLPLCSLPLLWYLCHESCGAKMSVPHSSLT